MEKYPNSIPTWGLIAAACLAVCCFFVGLWMDLLWLRLVSKPVPVLALMVWIRKTAISGYANAVLLGLGFSICGDILLEVPTNLFVQGLGAFLLDHLCYIYAFWGQCKAYKPLWSIPFVVWCGGMYWWMLPGLGNLLIPVGAYVGVIATMLWRAGATAKI